MELAALILLFLGAAGVAHGRQSASRTSPTPSPAPVPWPLASAPAQGGTRLAYRTSDGEADYWFSVERQSNGEYWSFIVSQPSYRGRAADCHSTHRLSAGGRHYICWLPQPTSVPAAERIIAHWSDRTQRYIKTGKRLEEP